MTANEHDRTPDEQVYQEHKQEPAVKVVYSNDPTNEGGADQQSSDVVAAADQDEASALSFPASDPPPTAVALPTRPKQPPEGQQ